MDSWKRLDGAGEMESTYGKINHSILHPGWVDPVWIWMREMSLGGGIRIQVDLVAEERVYR